MTRVDLPEPDTPVTAVRQPAGKSASTSSRLWRDAFRMPTVRLGSTGRSRDCTAVSRPVR